MNVTTWIFICHVQRHGKEIKTLTTWFSRPITTTLKATLSWQCVPYQMWTTCGFVKMIHIQRQTYRFPTLNCFVPFVPAGNLTMKILCISFHVKHEVIVSFVGNIFKFAKVERKCVNFNGSSVIDYHGENYSLVYFRSAKCMQCNFI